MRSGIGRVLNRSARCVGALALVAAVPAGAIGVVRARARHDRAATARADAASGIVVPSDDVQVLSLRGYSATSGRMYRYDMAPATEPDDPCARFSVEQVGEMEAVAVDRRVGVAARVRVADALGPSEPADGVAARLDAGLLRVSAVVLRHGVTDRDASQALLARARVATPGDARSLVVDWPKGLTEVLRWEPWLAAGSVVYAPWGSNGPASLVQLLWREADPLSTGPLGVLTLVDDPRTVRLGERDGSSVTLVVGGVSGAAGERGSDALLGRMRRTTCSRSRAIGPPAAHRVRIAGDGWIAHLHSDTSGCLTAARVALDRLALVREPAPRTCARGALRALLPVWAVVDGAPGFSDVAVVVGPDTATVRSIDPDTSAVLSRASVARGNESAAGPDGARRHDVADGAAMLVVRGQEPLLLEAVDRNGRVIDRRAAVLGCPQQSNCASSSQPTPDPLGTVGSSTGEHWSASLEGGGRRMSLAVVSGAGLHDATIAAREDAWCATAHVSLGADRDAIEACAPVATLAERGVSVEVETLDRVGGTTWALVLVGGEAEAVRVTEAGEATTVKVLRASPGPGAALVPLSAAWVDGDGASGDARVDVLDGIGDVISRARA